jgi:hypothetical protein
MIGVRYKANLTGVMKRFTSVAWNATEPDAVAADVFETISTDIVVTIDNVTMHLAAWMNPEHWSTDWEEIADGQDVDELIAGALTRAREED